MKEQEFVSNLTVTDIHKLRVSNYEKTKNMKPEERRDYYHGAAVEMQRRIDAIRAARGEETNCTWLSR